MWSSTELQYIFSNFFSALSKDLHVRGNYWTPTLVTDQSEARTVVLREFTANRSEAANSYSPLFCVHTDIRSDKWKALQENQECSLHFYCSKRRWQMRIKTIASLHTTDAISTAHWERLSDNARQIYRLVNEPGSKVDDPESAYAFQAFDADQADPGFKQFGVIELAGLHFESLELSRPDRGDFHIRAAWNTETNSYSFLAP